MKVIKRDGKQEEFNEVNIRKAIKAANNSVDKEKQISDEKVEKVLNFVLKNISSEEKVEIERIQDLVEDGLMKENCFEVAKSNCWRVSSTFERLITPVFSSTSTIVATFGFWIAICFYLLFLFYI